MSKGSPRRSVGIRQERRYVTARKAELLDRPGDDVCLPTIDDVIAGTALPAPLMDDTANPNNGRWHNRFPRRIATDKMITDHGYEKFDRIDGGFTSLLPAPQVQP